jgi:hypothetical protein
MAEKARYAQLTKIDLMMKHSAQLESEIGMFRSQMAEFDDRYRRALADNKDLAADLIHIRSVKFLLNTFRKLLHTNAGHRSGTPSKDALRSASTTHGGGIA